MQSKTLHIEINYSQIALKYIFTTVITRQRLQHFFFNSAQIYKHFFYILHTYQFWFMQAVKMVLLTFFYVNR